MAGRGRVPERRPPDPLSRTEGHGVLAGDYAAAVLSPQHPAQPGQRLGQFGPAAGGGEAEAQALRRLPRHREDIGGHHLDPRGEAAGRGGAGITVPRQPEMRAGHEVGRNQPGQSAAGLGVPGPTPARCQARRRAAVPSSIQRQATSPSSGASGQLVAWICPARSRTGAQAPAARPKRSRAATVWASS